MSLGYAQCRNDLMKEDENKGKLYTGDIAVRDSEGYLYIKGRKKRFVKLYGKRIGMDELENILSKMYKVDIYCGGNDSKVIIYLLEQYDIKECEIEEWVAGYLNISKNMIEFKRIKKIPRNSSGKIMYSEL